MDILVNIKRLIINGRVIFTKKAEFELEINDLTESQIYEAIINAPGISKRLRSVNPKTGKREYLYVIIGLTYDDMPIYTKGKILKREGREVFYVLISSKKSIS